MVRKTIYLTMVMVLSTVMSSTISAEMQGMAEHMTSGVMQHHMGLLSQTAKLKGKTGTSLADIAGWEYVAYSRETDSCYTYYAAQPGLDGTTGPTSVSCPMGIRPFDAYRVSAAMAIAIMNTMNCGNEFSGMSLSWPVEPTVASEPLWRIVTTLGHDIVIGANTGEASSCTTETQEASAEPAPADAE